LPKRRPLRFIKERREEAGIRQAEYDALSTEQKIARAEARPGNSLKELRRLRG